MKFGLLARMAVLTAGFKEHFHDLEFCIKVNLVVVLEVEFEILFGLAEDTLDDSYYSPVSDLRLADL